MKQIHSLPQDTINQIAAGEVIERPAQIIKELVENAIDAEAAHIEVEFDEGGRFLKVRDDGYGISREQMSLALARHATSKIREFDDLWNLSTHGFRGEALASIAAVSDLTLISQTKDSSSFKLRSCFGALQDIQPTGGAQGTLVIVQSLFENTPARFKFLKSPAGENTAIKQTLKALALSHFHISFRVLNRGRLLFYWPAQKNIVSRSCQVLGMEDLYFAEGRQGAYTLKAALAAPHNTLKVRRSSWFFVSHRWVECRVMQSALMAAYRGLLMHGEYPVSVIHLNGPGDEIDVNVHPAKSQVRFKDSSVIFRLVESSVRTVLEQSPWTRKINPSRPSSGEQNLKFRDFGFNKTQFPQARSGVSLKSLSDLAWREPSDVSENSFQEQGREKVNLSIEESTPESASSDFSEQTFKDRKPWSSLQVLAQAHLTYIVCQSDKALMFIDQHAAHERFLYETLFHTFKTGGMEVQNHLVPVSLNLEEDEMEAICSVKENLDQMGVQVERMGPLTVGVTASPALLKDQALKEGILLLLRKFVETRNHFSFEKVVSDLFATMACHSAIRAGQSLTEKQMSDLLKQMDQFSLSSFCPHGRPVFVEYPISRLERDFCRQV